YNLSGELLNKMIPAPIKCSENPTKVLTYQILFSEEEQINYIDSKTIIKVQLNSAQCQKGLYSTQNTQQSTDNRLNLDSSSTLSIVILSKQIAQQLKMNPSKLSLGEDFSGLANLNSKIASIDKVSNSNFIDLDMLSSKITELTSQPDSPFFVLKKAISKANLPEGLSQHHISRSKEFLRMITGNSTDSSDPEFVTKLKHSSMMIEEGNQLLSIKRQAQSAQIITLNSENSNIVDSIINSVFDSNDVESRIFELSKVLSNSIKIANLSNQDNNLRSSTQDNLDKVFHAIQMISLENTIPGTSLLKLVNLATDFSKDLIPAISNNDKLSGEIANLYSNGLVVLEKVKIEDQKISDNEEKNLHIHMDVSSKFTSKKQLIHDIVKQSKNDNTITKVLAGIIQNISEESITNQILLEAFDQIATPIKQDDPSKIKLSEILKETSNNQSNRTIIAKTLANSADDVSEVFSILEIVKSSIDKDHFNILISDQDLEARFHHNQSIYADAGPDVFIETELNNTTITLTAMDSFDPQNSQLVYQWYQLLDGTEHRLNPSGPSANNVSIITNVVSVLNDQIYSYRVKAYDDLDRSRYDFDDIDIFIKKTNAPNITVPSFLSLYLSNTTSSSILNIDASSSYCSNSCTSLNFYWDLSSSDQVQGLSLTDSQIDLSFTYPGVYNIHLTVSNDKIASTKNISILVKRKVDLVADIGSDLSIPQKKIIELGGYRLDNHSRSNTSSELNYEWTPRYLFSNEVGFDYQSKKPLFIASGAASYPISLKVRDTNGNISRDNSTIHIIQAPSPYVFAGVSKTVYLDQQEFILNLNGSESFSYITSTPTYKWTGSSIISNSSNATAFTTIYPNDYTEPTLLRYKLYVSDSLSSSFHSVDYLVIPKTNQPIIVVDKQAYSSGYITFDASRSFSSTSQINWFLWRVNGSIRSSTKQVIINLSNFDRDITLNLEVRDQNNESTFRQFLIPVGEHNEIVQAIIEPDISQINPLDQIPLNLSCRDEELEE
ncbi:hypothetical protein MJH12_17745, partial [bacterium]|nr:hypothetical protein [bacterium]